MFKSLEGWSFHQHYLHQSRLISSRQYGSASKPSQRRVAPSRPPSVPEKSMLSRKPTAEPLQQKEPALQGQRPRFRDAITPRFLRSRPALRSWIFGFSVALPITAFVLTHLPFTYYTVSGPSMRPTLNPDCEADNDALYKPTKVIVQKWSLNTTKEMVRRASSNDEIYTGKYKRGDIVVYWTPHDPEKIGVKRIVALPGDSVTPMKGYNGEDDPAPVIVPFNHLWIEGDVNDRRKSVDSNYYGPISQALVKGRVSAIWSPWWNIFGMHRVNSGETGWPARRDGRVIEGAVHEATVNPNTLNRKQSFEQGQQSEAILEYLREQPARFVERWEDESEKGTQFRVMIRQLSSTAYDVANGHEDRDTRERAKQVLLELQQLVGTKALASAATIAQIADEQKKDRWTPPSPEEEQKELAAKIRLFTDLNVAEDEGAKAREARTYPASAALKQMLQKKAQLASVVDKEYEELDKAKLQRSGFPEQFPGQAATSGSP